MTVKVFCLLVVASSSLAALPAAAIDTDGPDFVESAEVVGKGRFQYEADVVSERDVRSETVKQLSASALFRYGISPTLELRLAGEGDVRAAEAGTHRSGIQDATLGLKWHMQDKNVARRKPAVSWILHFSASSRASEFREQGVRPSLRTVIAWELKNGYSLGVMPGIKYDATEEGRRFPSGILGVALGRQLTDKLRGFVEFAAPQIARSDDGGVQSSVDIGGAYLLGPEIQIGARAGWATNRNTPSQYLLVELAQRF